MFKIVKIIPLNTLVFELWMSAVAAGSARWSCTSFAQLVPTDQGTFPVQRRGGSESVRERSLQRLGWERSCEWEVVAKAGAAAEV